MSGPTALLHAATLANHLLADDPGDAEIRTARNLLAYMRHVLRDAAFGADDEPCPHSDAGGCLRCQREGNVTSHEDREVECPRCGGTGRFRGPASNICPRCNGVGTVHCTCNSKGLGPALCPGHRGWLYADADAAEPS